MKRETAMCMVAGAALVLQSGPAGARRLADFLPNDQAASKESRTVASALKPAAQTPPPDPNDPRFALEAHGVKGGKKELIAFLERGLPKDRLSRMPEEPAEKCQLAIDAMARLAQARAREAVPVLVSIAALQLPKGVQMLMEIDLERTSPQSRGQYQDTALRLLQFNAVNALGLIGAPEGLEVVRAVFVQETNAAARIQHALSLACLGDGSGLEFLVQQIEQQNRRESAAAARVFTMITGEDFGYSEYTALRARRPRARQYRDWLKKNSARFVPNRDEVMKRRLEPRNPVPYQPRNTRDLLKLAACYFDLHNALGSRDARVRLKQAGPALNPELERIALDPMEDLDVRMEAMNWYYENNRSGARALMQRLRRDENTEIEDKANALLEQIEEGSGPLAQPMLVGR